MLNIKSLFNRNIINFLDPLTLDEFQSLELHCLNKLDHSKIHFHNGQPCKSPNMKYVCSYQRSYITFRNNRMIDELCEIAVVYCESCNHYHAILPNLSIVPHCQYSIFFILCVLYDKKCNQLTVEKVVEKYNISVSTLYRWLEKYSYYYSVYQQLRNKFRMHFFACLLDHYEEVIMDLFDICAQSLFQHNCNLSQPPPA